MIKNKSVHFAMNFNRKSENLLNAVGRVHTFILYRKLLSCKV